LFLACAFILLARPQDLLPFLQPLRPALVFTLLAFAALALGNRRQDLLDALALPESKRYLLFFFIMVLGIPFAEHRRLAFDGALQRYLVNVLFFLLVVSHVTTLARLKTVAWLICLCALMYGVFAGLLQSGGFGGGRFEVLGNVFDPNDTAYVLLSLFPPCLYFVRFNEGAMKKLVAIAAVCSAVAVILLTQSRGGALGLLAVLLLLVFTRAGGIGAGQKILVGLVLASAFYLLRDQIDVERYLTLTDLSSDYNAFAQGGRLDLWKAAMDLSLANPLTGVGVDCYPLAHWRLRMLAGETYLRYHAVHNSFLQIAAEVGLVGFAVYLIIILRSVFTFRRVSARARREQSAPARELGALAGLLLLGFAGLLVSGFFLSQGYSMFATLYFALAAVVARLEAASASPPGAVHRRAR